LVDLNVKHQEGWAIAIGFLTDSNHLIKPSDEECQMGEDFNKDLISIIGITTSILGRDPHIWKDGAWVRHPHLIEGEDIDLDRHLGGALIQGETDLLITDLWGGALHQ
jgi:hypothetical protein